MTYKQVKALLDTYQHKVRLLALKKEQLEAQRILLTDLQSVRYDKVSVQGSSSSSTVEKAVLTIDRYEKEYEKLCSEIFEIEDTIAGWLPLLNETEQSLIIERYMKGVSMSKIAKKYYYSYSRIKHKYGELWNKIANKTKS